MNFDKQSKSRKKIQEKKFFLFVCGGGGESSYGRYEHESCHSLYTLHIVIPSSIKPYYFMKIILTVFKIALPLKLSRGNNSESMQARVGIPVCDASL